MPTVTTITKAAREQLIDTLTVEELDSAYEALREILPGYDPAIDDDPLIDMPMVARLAGVAAGTPGAWQQRTREGKERVAFPDPGDTRYPDKPQWYAVSQIVAAFLKPSNRWPRGVVAREQTRAGAQPRLTFVQLAAQEPALAEELFALGVQDAKARTLQGWRGLRTRSARR